MEESDGEQASVSAGRQAVKVNGIPQPFPLKFYLTLITASEIHYNNCKGARKEKVVS